MTFDLSTLDPVALHIGPLVIRWYALAYLAGIILGWRYIVFLIKNSKIARPDPEDIDDFISWAVIGIILGGRLGYVFFYNWPFYAAHPDEIIKIWQGGMSFHGGLLGVLGAMAIFSYRRQIPFLRLADLVTAAAPIGLFFGRIANFINGELYGRITNEPWGVVFPHGGPLPRHPSQLYEAALEGVLLFSILYFCTRTSLRLRYGFCSGVFLLFYGSFRALVEMVREPDAQIGLLSFGLSMGQMLSLPMVALGGAVMLYAWRKGQVGDDPRS